MFNPKFRFIDYSIIVVRACAFNHAIKTPLPAENIKGVNKKMYSYIYLNYHHNIQMQKIYTPLFAFLFAVIFTNLPDNSYQLCCHSFYNWTFIADPDPYFKACLIRIRFFKCQIPFRILKRGSDTYPFYPVSYFEKSVWTQSVFWTKGRNLIRILKKCRIRIFFWKSVGSGFVFWKWLYLDPDFEKGMIRIWSQRPDPKSTTFP